VLAEVLTPTRRSRLPWRDFAVEQTGWGEFERAAVTVGDFSLFLQRGMAMDAAHVTTRQKGLAMDLGSLGTARSPISGSPWVCQVWGMCAGLSRVETMTRASC
jgi:hypothetical protein